jgi:glycosyltransferase involved in cell wall biosynthesis
MKLCFIVSEFFSWGKYGGYGSATRVLATELTRRGLNITVVTPARGAQPQQEQVDGVTVLACPAHSIGSQLQLLRDCGADVYHSQEPSLTTWLAMKAAPQSVHLVTCRDTRVSADWLIELRSWIQDGSFRTLLTLPYENNPLVTRAVRAAHAVFCPNEFSRPIAQRKYGLARSPGFLPTPVRPARIPVQKAQHPTVCFVGRWDRRKRPQIFFELAREFPDVRFIALGQARTAAQTELLCSRYGNIANLELRGFVDQFASDGVEQTLSQSWVLVNTALREGLPRSFLEAASFKCAILSRVDPEGFASKFGQRVHNDDFAAGLRRLLLNGDWRRKGEEGHTYVSSKYGFEPAINRHLEAYHHYIPHSRG